MCPRVDMRQHIEVSDSMLCVPPVKEGSHTSHQTIERMRLYQCNVHQQRSLVTSASLLCRRCLQRFYQHPVPSNVSIVEPQLGTACRLLPLREGRIEQQMSKSSPCFRRSG